VPPCPAERQSRSAGCTGAWFYSDIYARFHEHVQHLADGSLGTERTAQRQMPLDLVAVATTLLLLDDVTGIGEFGDDRIGAALGDVQLGGDVTQTHAGVTHDADQGTGVIGKKAPIRHRKQRSMSILEFRCHGGVSLYVSALEQASVTKHYKPAAPLPSVPLGQLGLF